MNASPDDSMAPPPRSATSLAPLRGRPWGKWLMWGAGSLLGVSAVSWVAVPPLLKWQLQKQASAALGRTVTVSSVEFQPWSLALTVRDVRVAKAAEAKRKDEQGQLLADDVPQFSVARVHVDLAADSLYRLAPVLDAMALDQPELHLQHLGDGRYDIDDIVSRFADQAAEPPKVEGAEPARFALYNVALRQGKVVFDDVPKARQHMLKSLDIALPFISSLPSQREIQLQPRLAFELNGSHFDTAAETTPFLNTRNAEVRLKIDALDLQPYLSYVPSRVPVALKSAVIDADLTLAFEQHRATPALTLSGEAHARQVVANLRDDSPLLSFAHLAVQLADVQPLVQQIHLKSVQVAQPVVHLSRDAQGLLNVMGLAGPADSAAKHAAAASGKASAAVPAYGSDPVESPVPAAQGGATGLGAENTREQVSGEKTAASIYRAPTAVSGEMPEGRTPAASETVQAKAAPAASAASQPQARQSPEQGAGKPSALDVRIGQVQVRDGQVVWRDAAAGQAEHPANLQLQALQVQAQDLRWPMASPVRFVGQAVLADAAVQPASSPVTQPATPQTTPSARDASAQADGGSAVGLAPAQAGDSRTEGGKTTAAVVAGAVPAATASSAEGAGPAVAAAPVASGTATASATEPKAPAPSLPALLALADLPAGGLSFAGEATPSRVTVQAHVQQLSLDMAGPYVRPFLQPELQGQLSLATTVNWAAALDEQAAALRIQVPELRVNALQLQDKSTVQNKKDQKTGGKRGVLPFIEQVTVTDLEVQPLQSSVRVGQLQLKNPQLTASRDARGRWMYESWLRPASPQAAAGASAGKGKPAVPWQVAIDELAWQGARIDWRDAQPQRPVSVVASGLQGQLKGFALQGKQAMQLSLSGRLGAGRLEPGRVSWNGALTQAPLSAKGEVHLQRLPVHAFEPYFGNKLNVELLRADASFKGRVDYADQAGSPRLRLQGDASVEELRAHSVSGSITDARAPAVVADVTQTGSARVADGSTRATTNAPVATRAQAQAAQQHAESAVVHANGVVASGAPLVPVQASESRGGLRLGQELLSWKTLSLRGLDVNLTPEQRPVVTVASTQLADFYARVIVQANGRLNLQDLIKADPAEASAAEPVPAESAASASGAGATPVPAGAASAASAAGETGTTAPAMGPVLSFGPTELVGGKVYFSDRFIKPNYSADLTELAGSLSSFSSETAPDGAVQMADLSLAGRAEGTAELAITGKLNPLAKPLALDVTGKVRELELPPLSPYTIKYAGHGIERGKMSVDVRYEVLPTGQLTASNKLVLNQLTFGEPVAGAPTSLPVKLAVMLLADRNGVIDLDLPLSGSLNDPQFSVGPIIVKAIFNIIGKAITAPFALLANAFGGGGEEMSQVVFEPGSSTLSPAARAQLDKVAKALQDRPGLKLTVSGHADLDIEREGYQRERLQALAAAEKRRASVGVETAAQPAAAASASISAVEADLTATEDEAPLPEAEGQRSAPRVTQPSLSSTEYATLLKRVYQRADIKKPRNAIGMAKDLPLPDMERLLMASVSVGENQMRQLAQARATAVRDYLTGQRVGSDRLFVGSSKLGKDTTEAASGTGAGAAPDATPSLRPAAGPNSEAGKPWKPYASMNLKTE